MSTNSPRSCANARSQIEQLIAVCRSKGTSSCLDSFRNQQPLQGPPWARGAYGGQLVAQALLAAYETVPALFAANSIHCHFLRPADVKLSIEYRVCRLYDGRGLTTRTIHAIQNQGIIMSATVSFIRNGTKDQCQVLRHSAPIPRDESPPGDHPEAVTQSVAGQAGQGGPCDCVRSVLETKGPPNERKLRQWVRARGRIQEIPLDAPRSIGVDNLTITGVRHDNHHVHVAALAYMTDNYFIGTSFRVHNASRFSQRMGSSAPSSLPADQEAWRALAEEEDRENEGVPNNNMHVGMAASLDHTIFFHRPHDFRADEWLLSEMESPWADDERGLVVGRIWNREGKLVATCIQEGVIRMSKHDSGSRL
ncbi:hypothetical protein FDECE_2920 [Fusarium decemcellulare]|nr:hypothetical protein FDECE_2920 [Fusarium decemcellulare]